METRIKHILLVWSVFMSTGLFAQIITVEVEGGRAVEKAYRIPLNPRIVDTVIPTPIIEYPLLQLKYETDTEVSMITPATISTKENLSQLYHSYLKLGIGTEFMPLGEYYFDSKRSKRFMYGLHVKHLSSFGNIKGYAPAQFDRTKVGLYGGLNERKYSIRGDVHYNNEGLHYYGYPVTLGELVKDSIAQRYSDFGFGASFSSHKKDSANINYTVGLNYNNFASKKPEDEVLRDWRANENYFGINTSAWYKLGRETYAADLNIKYNGYKYGIADSNLTTLDSGLVSNNTLVNLHPRIVTHLDDDRFKAKVGLNLAFNGQNGVNVHVYPDIEVKYSMFNDIFIPYVGLRGGMKQVSYKSLTGENQFLLSNVQLQNENTSIDFYGGIKGTLSKRVSFNLGASFANVKNQAFFVTDTTYSVGNQFSVIYDTMNVSTIEGSISYQLSDKLKIDGTGRFNSYQLNNNSYAWNKPQLQFLLRASYNLFDKFLFNLDVDLEQGRKALVYETGPEITEENGQFIKTQGFIADANFGVEYRYNKRISAFVQANNFASQQYMRWYNAPVQQFQVLGGVTFRF